MLHPHVLQMVNDTKRDDMLRDAQQHRFARQAARKDISRKYRNFMTISSVFATVHRRLYKLIRRNTDIADTVKLKQVKDC